MDPISRFPRIVERAHRVYNPHNIHPILDYLSQPLLAIGSLMQIAQSKLEAIGGRIA
jgi:hypothetical protein